MGELVVTLHSLCVVVESGARVSGVCCVSSLFLCDLSCLSMFALVLFCDFVFCFRDFSKLNL